MQRYVWNLLVSIDQLINTILGGFPDETLSSRMGKRATKGDRMAITFCKILDIFDKDHCKKYIEEDEGEPM